MAREYIEVRMSPSFLSSVPSIAMIYTGSPATAQELVDSRTPWSLFEPSTRDNVVDISGEIDGESLKSNEEAMWLLSNGWIMSSGGHTYSNNGASESYLMYRKT